MRWRGVSHVEFAVLEYDESIAFYDALFGWLGYDSFSSLNMEYQSIYYFTRYVNPHSYIGIQPARTGGKLTHGDQAVGINHIALWARSRKEVDRFHREFLIKQGVCVTDRRRSTRSTGPAITRCSWTTRSTGFIGNWPGCRKCPHPGRSGRSIAHCGFHPESLRSGENCAGGHLAGQEKLPRR